MLHFSRAKIVLIVLTCLAGLVFALPNFFAKDTVASWPRYVPRNQMALGLDLRGGAHLLLAMDTNEVRQDWLQNVRDEVRQRLREAKLGFTGLAIQGGSVQVRSTEAAQADKVLQELRRVPQQIGNALLGTSGVDLDVKSTEPGLFTLTPTEPGLIARITRAIEAAIETVRRRIDTLGTAEASVVRQGRDRILVQFPGLQDTRKLKDLIGQTARLTFHEVHPEVRAEPGRPRPPGFKSFPSIEGGRGDVDNYLLRETPIVRGDDLVDAQPTFDQQTQAPIISFRFNQSGARRFGKFTQENVGQPFAIVLDDKVLSAPRIQSAILGGSGIITGGFTVESATTLAAQLRSGALPAKLTIVEERTVGPSLGADSIEAGSRAGLVGALTTVLLTVLAYGTFGVFAVIGLIVNGLLIVALMSAFGSTLTLPGIAGLVLTIGMAVDANVLIYERIREELRAGRSTINAIDSGFSRAIVTIADSQLTTLAAAIIMFWLGSGPIRGFAVTLTIGIFTSVFTAVTVTRLMVALWLRSEKSKSRDLAVPI
jgi:preprotein translocase subunit SecD